MFGYRIGSDRQNVKKFGAERDVKNLIKGIGRLLAALALAAAVTGCGVREVSASRKGLRKVARVLEDNREQGGASLGSVPYFRDDAGTNTQTVGGYLYGYWNNRLCRYDLDTMEETVLYEAASPQHGDFCIWGNYVYSREQ